MTTPTAPATGPAARDPAPKSSGGDAAQRAPLWWWAAFAALALVVALALGYVGGDGLFYIAHGRFILTHHEIPAVDPFSDMSTRGPLYLYMLLPMIAFAVLEAQAGLDAVYLVSALAGAAVLVAFLLPARRSLLATIVGAALLLLLALVDRSTTSTMA